MNHPERLSEHKKKQAGAPRRHLRLFLHFFADLLIIGAIALVFCLYYFLLPRKQESLGIKIDNPYAKPQESSASQAFAEKNPATGEEDPEDPSDEETGAAPVTEPSGAEDPGEKPTADSLSESGTETRAGEPSEPETREETTPAPTEPPTTAKPRKNIPQLMWTEKFEDHFSEEVVVTDHSYTSPTVAIDIQTFTKESKGKTTLTYYIADIYVADISCFRTAMAGDTYGVGFHESVLDMTTRNGGILGINGDFYGYQKNGLVIRNGELYRCDETDSEICVLFYDGTMEIFGPDYDIQELIAKGAYQAWTFGPALLDADGHAVTEVNVGGYLQKNHPRTAVGYIEPGHYCFAVFDGRQSGYSNGIKFTEMAYIMESFGCTAAYNLDGGKTSAMVFNGSVYDRPVDGGRNLSDCLLIREAE